MLSFFQDRGKTFWSTCMILSISVLCVIGLLEVYSTTSVANISIDKPAYWSVMMQGFYMILGLGLAIAIAKMYPIFNLNARLIWLFWGLCVLGVLAVAIIGVERNGAKRWIEVGGATVQPSEFLKIALMLVFVKILSEYDNGETDARQTLIKAGIFVVMPLVILFGLQKDLGTTLICVACLLAIAYMGGINISILLGVIIIGVLGIAFLVFASGSFRSSRFLFIDPWNDGQNGQGEGFNLIRSYYAIAGGGLIGKGIGNSHEKYDYLFASDNDFIFAVICEELGLLGALVVIICVVMIFVSGIKLADHCGSTETKLIVLGASTLLTFQALLNIGCAVGALPTTGKPFPFVSSGGSSVVTSFMLVGLIFNCVNYPVAESVADRRRSKLQIVSSEKGSDLHSDRYAQQRMGTVPKSGISETRSDPFFHGKKSLRKNSPARGTGLSKSSISKSETRSDPFSGRNSSRRMGTVPKSQNNPRRRGYIDYD